MTEIQFMKRYTALTWITATVAIFAFLAAGFGLFTPNTGNRITFTTIRGETVSVWGQGLYKYDSPIGATGFMAADAVTLFVGIPMVITSSLLYRRGSLKGGLLLSGTYAYFLYNYISVGFGAAYNNFFLAYVIILAVSLYGLVLVLFSFDVNVLRHQIGLRVPRKGIGIFMIVSGVILSLIWLALSILPALIANKTPLEASYYTTFTTAVIDIALVAPALILAGTLIRRDLPLGYLLSATLLVFTCILGTALTLGGVLQVLLNVISIAQAMVFTVPFVILSLIALFFTVHFFQNISEPA
jgi:hypothetical protein